LRICRPAEAVILFGLWFYKDFAPTAMEIGSGAHGGEIGEDAVRRL